MTELKQNEITLVHIQEKVIKVFDNVVEALDFHDKLKEMNIKTSVDPLDVYLIHYSVNWLTKFRGLYYKEF
jgi:hypothetical protein